MQQVWGGAQIPNFNRLHTWTKQGSDPTSSFFLKKDTVTPKDFALLNDRVGPGTKVS